MFTEGASMGMPELRLNPDSAPGPLLGQSQVKWTLGSPDLPLASNCGSAEAAAWVNEKPPKLRDFPVLFVGIAT